jgi:ElaB/YqjD/DUF883 family membrane-anchored ribosome-binding protein
VNQRVKEDTMAMGEHNPNLDIDNLHLTAEEVAAKKAADAAAGIDTDVVNAGVALKDAAVGFGSQLKATVAITNAFITKAVKENPALTFGSAAGAGFVVGGGLSAPLTRSLLRVGMKAGGAFLLDAAIKTLTAVATNTSDSTRDSRRATSSEDTLSSETSISNGETT